MFFLLVNSCVSLSTTSYTAEVIVSLCSIICVICATGTTLINKYPQLKSRDHINDICIIGMLYGFIAKCACTTQLM